MVSIAVSPSPLEPHKVQVLTPGQMDNKMQMMLAKMIEEKHTFTYKKLVVPMSMRSIYWKYFGFPATDSGEILTKVKIVCILCKTQIAYNRNTSNLRMHLQNKHAQELADLESTAVPRKQARLDIIDKRPSPRKNPKTNIPLYCTNMDGTVSVEGTGDVQFITDPNSSFQDMYEVTSPGEMKGSGSGSMRMVHYKPNTSSQSFNHSLNLIMPDDADSSIVHHEGEYDGKSISEAIAEFMIFDLQVPNIVYGRGFQRLIATLRSPCEIPSKDKLEDDLMPKIYLTFKEAAFNSVTNIPGDIGLTVEEWQHCSGEIYVTISIYYQITLESAMENKVLSTIHCSPYMDWHLTLEQFFIEWDLKLERITAVVTATTQEELLKALAEKDLILIPCLVHSLQICTNHCFEQIEVNVVLCKIRGMIGLISRNEAASTSLKIQEQMLQQEEAVLKMDYPRVWTSTYNMLEAFSLLKNSISSILENIDGLDKEVVSLTEGEWKLLEDLVTVLEPFKVTMMTLGEEKYPLISLLKPLLWQLNSQHLRVKETDSEAAAAFKELLAEHLNERYSNPTVNVTLQVSTALDPRFKKLAYATDEDRELVNVNIKEQLVKFVDEAGEAMTPPVEDPMPKKSRLSGLEFILGDLCTSQSGIPPSERANLEIVQYQSEQPAPLDDCPLQWWAKSSSKCPNLSKLAQKYNCVPASATPVARIPVDAQVWFDTKRATLLPDMVDKQLFLNAHLT